MARSLPTGEVTFLFTDIEGSTRLWERDSVAMALASQRHEEILTAAIAKHGGHPFKWVGDAVQAAFADSRSAVRAARDAQRSLVAEDWVETGRFWVRMALHRGPGVPNDAGDYNRIACLNRLSRIMSVGAGGQVLISEAVQREVADTLPEDVHLVSLGSHYLRDLTQPESIAQLSIDGLPDQFPPLKSLSRYPTNIPTQPNPLIGRTSEVAWIVEWLRMPGHRLLTITGPGGIGKTRVALQAAAELLDDFLDGVWFIELGSVDRSDLVMPTIEASLGIRGGGGRSGLENLHAFLRERTSLLVLDNMEHLLAAAPAIARLIVMCPTVTVLVTSRIALGIQAEDVRPLSSLAVPPVSGRRGDQSASVIATDATMLFVQRARARRDEFELTKHNWDAVAAICRRLDGLPLAIEIAAAQITVLSPAEILAELDDRFELIVDGPRDLLPHQQSLWTTINWSYNLLSEQDRLVFRALAVFANDFSRDAATAVVHGVAPSVRGLDRRLGRLADASLMRLAAAGTEDESSRYAMLESLRAFGHMELVKHHELVLAEELHRDYYLRLTGEAANGLKGSNQDASRAQLLADHDNIRLVLTRALKHSELPTVVRLVEALWGFWSSKGLLSEGRQWIEAAIALAADRPQELGVAVYVAAASLAGKQGDQQAAQHWFAAGMTAATAAGDRTSQARLLHNHGTLKLSQGRHHDAADLLAQSIAICEALHDDWRAAHVRISLASVHHYLGDVASAEHAYREVIGFFVARGDHNRVIRVQANLALVLVLDSARHEDAIGIATPALVGARERELPAGVEACLTALGLVALERGDLAQAAAYFIEGRDICLESNEQSRFATAVGNLALVRLDQGRLRAAGALAVESLDHFTRQDDSAGVANALAILALIAARNGDALMFRRLRTAAEEVSAQIALPLQSILQRRLEAVGPLAAGPDPASDDQPPASQGPLLAAIRHEIMMMVEELPGDTEHCGHVGSSADSA